MLKNLIIRCLFLPPSGEISCAENTLVPSEGSVLITDSELSADDNVNDTSPTVVVVLPSPSPSPQSPLMPRRDKGDPLINRESLDTPKSEGWLSVVHVGVCNYKIVHYRSQLLW